MGLVKSTSNLFSLLFGKRKETYSRLFDSYRDFDEISKTVNLISKNNLNSKKIILDQKSTLGNEILGLKIGNLESQNKFLVTGLIHGNEFISGEICLRIAENFSKNYQNENFQVHFIPVLNPDSFVKNTEKLKNKKIFGRNQRTNPNGVDLNRNFPPERPESKYRTYKSKMSLEYSGEFPLSENEAKAISDYVLKENFKAVVNLHSFSNVLLYPSFYSQEKSKFRAIAESLKFGKENYTPIQGADFWRETALKRFVLKTLRGTTKICGTFDDWLLENQIPSILLEISAPKNIYDHIWEFLFCDVAIFNPEPKALEFHLENLYPPILQFFSSFKK
ncbi:MAG: hypothetical protein DWQ06_09870 [Calditrichaeota bacterium]|nr:MAG: hypothetical protein DWQ06_09870 [Calditrichota bacterium]